VIFYPKLVVRRPLLPQQDSLSKEDLLSFLADEKVQTALALASPEFLQVVQKLLDGKIKEEKKVNKILQSAYKYLLRMMNRPTPFGFFAGSFLADWGKVDQLQYAKDSSKIIRFSIASQLLRQLKIKLEGEVKVREQLTYQLNNSLYQKQGKAIYVRHHYANRKILPALSFARLDEYLTLIIEELATPKSYQDLVVTLTTYEPLLATSEASQFIDALLSAQIIDSNLSPQLAMTDWLNEFQQLDFKELPNAKNWLALFTNLQELILLEGQQIKLPTSLITKIIHNLQKIGIPFDAEKIFKGHLSFAPARPILLGDKLQHEIIAAIQVLGQLFPNKSSQKLRQFGEKYMERYGATLMPVLAVLDPERGLGYPIYTDKSALIANKPAAKTGVNGINRLIFALQAQDWKPGYLIDLGELELEKSSTDSKNNFPSNLFNKI